jgi:hypothetical protein
LTVKLWSQFACLGAAIAALAPAVADADDEPEKVEIPTLDTDNQPVAAATIGAENVDPDANLMEDMEFYPKVHVAALPATPQLIPLPEDQTSRLRGGPAGGGAKPQAKVLPHSRSWHGGGQRYGG